jgi:hypothetical protein
VTDPKELTETDLLLLWRALSTEDRERFTAEIIAAIRSPKVSPKEPPKKRGPRAKSHTKARQLARKFDAYKEKRGGRGSVKKLWAGFVATLSDELLKLLLPKGSIGSRGKPVLTQAIHNQLTLGRELNRQRPALRRLVAALRAPRGLAAVGTHPMRSARGAVRAGRVGRRGDAAEIEVLARAEEFYLDSATRALLGDEAVAARSFIRMPRER